MFGLATHGAVGTEVEGVPFCVKQLQGVRAAWPDAEGDVLGAPGVQEEMPGA